MNDQELQELLQSLPPVKAPKDLKQNVFDALEKEVLEEEALPKNFLQSRYLGVLIGILSIFAFAPSLSLLRSNPDFGTLIPSIDSAFFYLVLSLLFLIFAIDKFIAIRFSSYY